MSWEYLFTITLIAALLLPTLQWLCRSVDSKVKLWLFMGLHLAPYLGASVAFLIEKQGDLFHFFKLCFLEWSLTWIMVTALYHLAEGPKKLGKVYFVLLSSLLSSGLLFLMTPSLVFSDPFFGIIPGAFALDPIIDLHFFAHRLQAFIVAWAIILLMGLKLRWSLVQAFCVFFLSPFVLDQFRLGANTLKFGFNRHFDGPFQAEEIKIYVEKNSSIKTEANQWLKEFQFHRTEVVKRLPSPQPKLQPIEIYLYDTDESKAHMIGARQTQVGNFLRREMHLSTVELNEEILRHELVHLIHSSLDAPLRSFIDPLIFEGLAVALSSPSPVAAIKEAAAVAQLPEMKSKQWPHGLQFYSELPIRAAYRLAGGFAALQLINSKWPWTSHPDFEALNDIRVDNEELEAARKLFEQKPLHKDPLLRDCSRIYRDFRKSPTYSMWLGPFRRTCPTHPLLYRAAKFLPSNRYEALNYLRAHSLEAEGDFFILKDKFFEAHEIYNDQNVCTTRSCYWKAQLLNRGFDLTLKKIIESGPSDLKEILQPLKGERQALNELISIVSLQEGYELLKEASRKRNLSDDEEFELMEREFYTRTNRSENFETTTAIQRLGALQIPRVLRPRFERFIARLHFEN